MNLDLIKQRLDGFKNKPKKDNYEKIDYTRIYFTPKAGKQVIRVVPSKHNPENPFMEVWIHYGIHHKMMISPKTWGEKDPIIEFAKELRKTNDKENWQLSKKIEPKMRVFVPVVVRGEEDKGVRLWNIGKEMYLEFLSLADDEDIGDFTDVNDGRDITVDTVGPEITGTKYNKSSIRVKPKTTALASTKEEIEKYLNEQPNPLDGKLFKKYSFDEMKDALQKWLTPEAEENATVASAEDEAEEVGTEIATPASVGKKSNTTKFDDLFGEDD